MSEREFVHERVHFIRKSGHSLGVAEPHLEHRAVPDCDKPRHGPSPIASAGMCALHARARLLNQTEMDEWVGKQAEQRDLRIHEEFTRTDVQPLGKREPALQPCPGGARTTLKLIDLPMNGARGRQKH